MYQDAKEELQRLEEALLAEQEEETVPAEPEFELEIEFEDDEPAPSGGAGLTVAIVLISLLTAGTLGAFVWWLVRYGSALL